ncbi:phospholipid carrier-dependent glycosyltransferase [Candidatus Poribacteria bacterium]|nr:phospholipid carrier-dependent glycosyltransferase [Candidatus Poribacteria bacterium]
MKQLSLKTLSLFFGVCLFVAASASRLFSLGAHWTSDERGWLDHSTVFMAAVEMGAFSETLVTFHPGIITMWIAALRTFFTEPHISVQGLALARWFIGVVLLVGIGVAAVLLYRLFGRWVALIGAAFLSFSPLFLAQSRRVHTDALASIFVLLTVLSLLLYCGTSQKRRYLIGSGIAFGLACLAKSYSLILLLWVPICFVLFRNREETWREFFLHKLGAGLCFLSCTLLTVFALLPIFWNPTFLIFGMCLLAVTLVAYRELQKAAHGRLTLYLASVVVVGVVSGHTVRTVWRVFDGVAWAITTPHNVEHFFLGQALYDPGWLYYPLVLCIKTTPLTFPLVFAGCLFLWRKRYQEGYARQFRIALGLVAVVLLFTLCLSMTSKKFSRYLLPAFPILEILAAVGFFEFLKWGYSYIDSRFGTETNSQKLTFSIVTILCLTLIQILPVLRLHPYYSTYYNLCFKLTDIRKIITVSAAAGYDLAAKHLNGKPNAQALRVQTFPQSAQFFFPYFVGQPLWSDAGEAVVPDYEVVHIRESQAGWVPQTGTLNGELEHVITLNGIDYVWIYRIPQ